MTVELTLFILIGAIAVASAVMMLLSENAVHSALFLIVVMGCIAFLFLMLEAPFLAMVQIAVYAGAIMVLFLFVIMLLGAEKAEVIEPQDARRFKWQPALALILAVSLLGLAGLAIIQGKIDLQTPPTQPASLRFAQFAPDLRDVDIYVNGELLTAAPAFGAVTDFQSVPAGEYAVNIALAGRDASSSLADTTVTLEPGEIATVIAYGAGRLPSLSVVNDDLSSVPERSARIAVFNAYNSDVSLARLNSELFNDARNVEIIVPNIPVGIASTPVLVDEGIVDWTVIEAGSETLIASGGNWNGRDGIVVRLNDYEIERGTSQLLVLTNERLISGELRPLVTPLVSQAIPAFGSPQAIGYTLFTTYMLPFQMIALLLLVAMIGAVVLTHKEPATAPRRRDIRRKVSRPLTSVIAAQTGTDIMKSEAETPEPTAPTATTTEPTGD